MKEITVINQISKLIDKLDYKNAYIEIQTINEKYILEKEKPKRVIGFKARGGRIMIYTLILAWILTWFDIDNLIISGINELFKTDFTTAIYWLFFFVLGLIQMIFKE